MSKALQGIAARYAAALRASEAVAAGVSSVPSATEIWLYKIEDAVTTLVNHWAKKKPEPPYDPFCLYAHHFCLKAADDVRRAPDKILLEAMGLNSGPFGWGWLQFIIRDMGWHSMLAANWGLPTLVIPDGVGHDQVKEEHRRAQAVYYFREVMRDLRGWDILGAWLEQVGRVSSRFEAVHGRAVAPERLAEWVKKRSELAYFLHVYGENPPPASVLSKPGPPAYKGAHLVEFRTEIRAAAGRRRAVWAAEWECDCAERRAKLDRAEGMEAEAAGVAQTLKGESVLRRGEDIGAVPEDEVLSRLRRYFDEWMASEPHIRNTYLHDRLEVFLARNPEARELLRLPENRKFAAEVKREVRWLYLPGWKFAEGGGVSHMAA